jgi:hypothetical protein
MMVRLPRAVVDYPSARVDDENNYGVADEIETLQADDSPGKTLGPEI